MERGVSKRSFVTFQIPLEVDGQNDTQGNHHHNHYINYYMLLEGQILDCISTTFMHNVFISVLKKVQKRD
jgi:hypothetical protein